MTDVDYELYENAPEPGQLVRIRTGLIFDGVDCVSYEPGNNHPKGWHLDRNHIGMVLYIKTIPTYIGGGALFEEASRPYGVIEFNGRLYEVPLTAYADADGLVDAWEIVQ